MEQLANNEPQKKKEKPKRPSKLDPFKTIIENKVAQNIDSSAIFHFIKNKGFEGKYTIVREYAKQFRDEQVKKATIRVETTPGLLTIHILF